MANNIKGGSPSKTFVWSEEWTVWKDNESFGYVMEIFPKGYEDFPKFLNAGVKFHSVYAMVEAALNMVLAFNALHNKGYNYQNLNDGNISMNPDAGDVLICDNDNIMG